MKMHLSDTEQLAKRIEHEYSGDKTGGIELHRIGDYIVVDDGFDSWLTTAEAYDSAVNQLVADVEFGTMFDGTEDTAEIYAHLRDEMGSAIYSQDEHRGDTSAIDALDIDSETRTDILGALGLDQ